jgi:GNAT superfamily N-acetyltransferase
VADPVAVRAVEPADRDEIERLRSAARAELAELRGADVLLAAVATAEAADHVSDHTLAGDGISLVGTIGEVVVGVAIATRRGDRADLEELFVEAPARRVGVGHALLEAVLGWAKAGGCRGLDSRALPGARDTKNFFESHGMVSRLIVVARDIDGA